jgi:hypothetical protein
MNKIFNCEKMMKNLLGQYLLGLTEIAIGPRINQISNFEKNMKNFLDFSIFAWIPN